MKKKAKEKRRTLRTVLLLLLGAIFLLLALPQGRSLLVMSVYGKINERQSIEAEEGLYVRLPGGASTLKRDWYPLVSCFEVGTSFGRSIGEPDTRLTILYNFGAFGLSGHSSLYDRESPYYNSFYGAYLVKRPGTPYGFRADGTVDMAAMAQVPRYDFSRLVLADFGLSPADFVFDWEITGTEETVSLAGYDDWTRIEAKLLTSSAAHERAGFVTSYLQYGAPSGGCEEPFEPIGMVGLIYVRYFPEEETSVFLYALCTGDEVLRATDRDFLQKVRVAEKN